MRDFCEYAFSHAGLTWEEHVRHDEVYERPTDVDALIGDASKARRALDWSPRTSVEELARIMVDADVNPDLRRIELTLMASKELES